MYSMSIFQGEYEEAISYFERVKDSDLQALYQLAVCKFDGLGGCKNDYVSTKQRHALRNPSQKNLRLTNIFHPLPFSPLTKHSKKYIYLPFFFLNRYTGIQI